MAATRVGVAADFELPALPYAHDALEPHIDARTMEIHHSKHHAAYVNGLKTAVEGTPWAKKAPTELVAHLGEVPENIRTAVRNSGGGHVNHTLFWTIMSPKGGGKPKGELASAIDSQLGGFDAFATALTDAAMKRFGSGWAWLAYHPRDKKLVVNSTANQDSPLTEGLVPILGIDVWEHAYYLRYQNRRADYVKAFFNVISWDAVAANYAAARA
ncbi:MAG: superoxide dismutase [Planctomycetes bacterium]|nr:superoxide dismutase [Planctomycetota bacterium]